MHVTVQYGAHTGPEVWSSARSHEQRQRETVASFLTMTPVHLKTSFSCCCWSFGPLEANS